MEGKRSDFFLIMEEYDGFMSLPEGPEDEAEAKRALIEPLSVMAGKQLREYGDVAFEYYATEFSLLADSEEKKGLGDVLNRFYVQKIAGMDSGKLDNKEAFKNFMSVYGKFIPVKDERKKDAAYVKSVLGTLSRRYREKLRVP